MSIVDDVLPIIDQVRGEILDEVVGLCGYDILMRTVQWLGDRPGIGGPPTVTDTPLTLDGKHRIRVNRLTSRDVLASGGKYSEGDYKVGPITPKYAGGGREPSYFIPALNSQEIYGSLEVYYRLTGAGMEGGIWFRLVDHELGDDGPFSYFFTLRAANVTNPGGSA